MSSKKSALKEALNDVFYKSQEIGLEYNDKFKERKKMIADRLKELRIKRNLTQGDVAKEIDINRGTYAGYEIERTEPNTEVLTRLAIFYDVSMDYLCCLTDNPFGRYSNEEREEKAKAEIENIQNQIDELQKKIENLK